MFILDEGLKIYMCVWVQVSCERSFQGVVCVADRINKLERKNKAQLSMFRAVSESQRERERERE